MAQSQHPFDVRTPRYSFSFQTCKLAVLTGDDAMQLPLHTICTVSTQTTPPLDDLLNMSVQRTIYKHASPVCSMKTCSTIAFLYVTMRHTLKHHKPEHQQGRACKCRQQGEIPKVLVDMVVPH